MADTYMDKSLMVQRLEILLRLMRKLQRKGAAMHDADNQNTSNVSANKVGDSTPFEKETKVNLICTR